MICGQGVAERWARADGGLRGRVAPCPVESRSAGTGAGREHWEAAWRRGWEAWMHGLRPERVRHNCWPCARRSRAGRCGRGEAAHPQTQLDTEHAVDASKGARRPRQRRCVNYGLRASTKITDAEQGDLACCLTDLSQAPLAPQISRPDKGRESSRTRRKKVWKLRRATAGWVCLGWAQVAPPV